MANIITSFRILCALALLFCPAFSRSFYIFYLLGGLSDVLDGFAARHWGQETELGAKLDTVADTLFTGAVLAKVLLAVYIPRWMLLWVLGIALVKCINLISSLVRYGRLVPEHTVANKLCGLLLFCIPLCIGHFPRQGVMALCILCCSAAGFAAVQEGHYIRSGKEIR